MNPTRVDHAVDLTETGGQGRPFMSLRAETAWLLFETTWRGQPATVDLTASRSRGSDDVWSEWFVGVRDARQGTYENMGTQLTDTARQRLREQHVSDVETWLASDAYEPSAQRAMFFACREVARRLRGSGDPPSRDLRRAVDENRQYLTDSDAERLLRAANAYDLYMKELNP